MNWTMILFKSLIKYSIFSKGWPSKINLFHCLNYFDGSSVPHQTKSVLKLGTKLINSFSFFTGKYIPSAFPFGVLHQYQGKSLGKAKLVLPGTFYFPQNQSGAIKCGKKIYLSKRFYIGPLGTPLLFKLSKSMFQSLKYRIFDILKIKKFRYDVHARCEQYSFQSF